MEAPAPMARVDRRELAAIFAGGMVGAVLRVWVGQQFASTAPHWPWATFVINVTGSAALAYFATRLQERLPLSTYRRPFLGTGFCGAYTTFSTMQVEILTMLDHYRYGLAVGYTVASIAAGYFAIWATTALVRRSRLA
jgi:CrcB protein